MTIEEKLQYFYDASVTEARKMADNEINAHKKFLEESMKKHKLFKEDSVASQLKTETENAQREVNKALSSEQLAIRRNWTKKENELKAKLFAEVKDLLLEYRETEEYRKQLVSLINSAKDFAGNDELKVYVSPEDKEIVDALRDECKVDIEIWNESFLGGMKAAIPHKNILIDHSLLENYLAKYKEFKFDGGLKHE